MGNGPNSDEASATPETPFTPPTDTVPDAPQSLMAGTPRRPLIVDWTWEVPNDNGGQRIEDYDHQWRYSGDAWAAANLETTEGSYRRVTDCRYHQQRAGAGEGAKQHWRVGVVGNGYCGVWRPASRNPTQRHRFTSSQTWNWPYDDLDRAGTVLLYGARSRRSPATYSRDINAR